MTSEKICNFVFFGSCTAYQYALGAYDYLNSNNRTFDFKIAFWAMPQKNYYSSFFCDEESSILFMRHSEQADEIPHEITSENIWKNSLQTLSERKSGVRKPLPRQFRIPLENDSGNCIYCFGAPIFYHYVLHSVLLPHYLENSFSLSVIRQVILAKHSYILDALRSLKKLNKKILVLESSRLIDPFSNTDSDKPQSFQSIRNFSEEEFGRFLTVYKNYYSLMKQEIDKIGIPVFLQPSDTFDENKFTLENYRRIENDSFHTSQPYGEIVFPKLLKFIEEEFPGFIR